ncbi:hypothetical protein FC83_GL001162 [Agrilactobacillus composti DSM 18527 = JCM 14202]|uniref:Uncharacterized protein n=1 Tax=Agrilactobacillus composti DSM 18527 = JCM 14202 TaxID=1423734 RepID=A0A0R1XVC1_9LACO|nr:daptomycin-sensing surface protein LiaX [Agrilactobacillus composti]KRM31158.1 hypothetical protein FC83_GL001162 [Agrilactobacillus composti DSM 18527 = JCM 14202]
MNERQRILDLVKKGVISSEEALVLLENLELHDTEDQASADTADKQSTPDSEKEPSSEYSELKIKQETLAEQLKSIDHQIQAAKEQITVLDTMEDLEGLSDAKNEERTSLKQRVNDLTQTQAAVRKQLNDVTDDLKQYQADHHLEGDHAFEDFAGNWRENASGTLSDFTKRLTDAGSQVGSFVRDSVSNLMDNVDWKDINVKVPGLATAEFEHEFLYENNQAKVLDLSLANGTIKFEPSENDNIAVNAKVKLFGSMSEATPFEAFLARANIDVSNDRFVFQVPNKRVKADLIVYLPQRTYDHINVKMLNGNLKVTNFAGTDFYAKTANGQLDFEDSRLTYLEAENVNGDIQVEKGQITDTILTTVNGNVIVSGNVHTGQFTTVNGEVRGTTENLDLHKFAANSVNGNVKLALSPELALKAEVKTRFGQIKNRLADITLDDQADARGRKQASFERGDQTDPAVIDLSTTAGNILLKDTNQADE